MTPKMHADNYIIKEQLFQQQREHQPKIFSGALNLLKCQKKVSHIFKFPIISTKPLREKIEPDHFWHISLKLTINYEPLHYQL